MIQLINVYKLIIFNSKMDEFDFFPKEFNPDNFHLSGLASCAAVAIDNHLLSESGAEYSYVTRLGKMIYMSTEPQITPHNLGYVAAKEDDSLSVFLAKFLEATGKKPQTIDDVVSQTKEMALSLIKMRELPRDEQVKLRDICVQLSKSLSAFWQEYNPTGFKRYVA